MATMVRDTIMTNQVVNLADRYAESAMESLPLLAEDQRKPILAGAFLSFLEDIFALIDGDGD